jgi:hypothetical protein
VFRAFAGVCGLVVDSSSIRCGVPPEPDIICTVDGEERSFELVRAVNEAMVRVGVALRREASERGAAHYVGTPSMFAFLDDPLRKKAAKRYVAKGRIDLLLWLDGTKDHLPTAAIEAMPQAVKNILGGYPGRWREVWLFDPRTGRVIETAG